MNKAIAVILVAVIFVTSLTACGGSGTTLSGKYYVDGDETKPYYEFRNKDVTDSSSGLVCKYRIDGDRLILSVGAFDVEYTLSKDKKEFTGVGDNTKYIKN